MKILLHGLNYSPELTGIGKYSGELARWCAEHGHEVRVVTAPAYYPDWKVQKEFSALKYRRTFEDGVLVTRCPIYVPPRPSTFKRVLHLLSFSLTSSLALFSNLRWKPELVVQVAPTLFCSGSTLLFSKWVRAQAVLHIQDYEVDAMFGLSMVSGSFLKRFAYGFERAVLRRFSWVSTISAAMVNRAAEKGVEPEKLILFPNWSELERFESARRDDELLASLGIDPEKKLILYSGSMGEKQGLEIVLQAASLLRDRQDVQFLMVGEGGAKRELVSDCESRQLNNIVFASLQPSELLPNLLASADCHLVIQKRGAADSVLPSKLTNILAVGGNAVITADDGTCLGDLTREWPGIACRVEPESVSALVDGIQQVLSMAAPNIVALDYAKNYLDKDTIISRFMAHFGN